MKLVTPKTTFFTWDIQYQCNYHCTYCFLNFEQSSAKIKRVILTQDEWSKIWSDIYKRYGECQIQITGGEPFIYPDFIDLITRLSRLHMFSFSTNLSWDVEEFINKVPPHRAKIDTSFHPEFAKLEDFLNKVKILTTHGYLTSVTMVAYPPLLKELHYFGDKFKDNGIKLIIYPYRGPYGGRFYPEGYTEEEVALIRQSDVDKGEGVSKRLMIKYLPNSENPGNNSASSIAIGSRDKNDAVINENTELKRCLMGYRYAKILPNADVYRCCAAIWDKTKAFKNWGSLGNLVKKTFRLQDEPTACNYRHLCACYKAMVVGDEERWFREWQDIRQTKETQEMKARLNEIKQLRDEHKFDAAINAISAILSVPFMRPRAFALLAEIHCEQDNLTQAERCIKVALEDNLDTDNLSWIYRVSGKIYGNLALQEGAAAEKKNNVDLAFDYFAKAIKAGADSNSPVDQSEAYYEKALVCYLLNDFEAAIENINLAMRYNPRKVILREKKISWTIKGKLYPIRRLRDLRQYDEAASQFIRLLDDYPEEPEIMILLAEVYIEQNQLSKAEQLLKACIAKTEQSVNLEDSLWPRVVLGNLYKKMMCASDTAVEKKEKFDTAIINLLKAKKIATAKNNLYGQSQVYGEMSQVYYLSGDTDKAMEYVGLAIQCNPQNEVLKRMQDKWKSDGK